VGRTDDITQFCIAEKIIEVGRMLPAVSWIGNWKSPKIWHIGLEMKTQLFLVTTINDKADLFSVFNIITFHIFLMIM